MDTIKTFRKCNKISHVALAEYLNVTQGFISQIEKGICPIPESVISKLLENPYNWDVSMLQESENPVAEQPVGLYGKDEIIIMLRDMLTEERSRNDALQERINELIEENARLKTLIEGERKGGVA